MTSPATPGDGLCKPALEMRPAQLVGMVCVHGGLDCPLLNHEQAAQALALVRHDPTAAIRLVSDCDCVIHHAALYGAGAGPTPEPGAPVPAHVFNRKRDLDVLQRLGLAPGDTRRARYLFELLFDRIPTPDGICAYDTPGWEGCAHARSGAYEAVRGEGWQALVYARSEEEMRAYRERTAAHIARDPRLFIRPHHFMCMACWYAGGENTSPRPNDLIWELYQRITREPDVEITLVEGCCDACDCCDGFHPETTRCVHACGLIRDYKKDLDVLQRLGLAPGATLPAREFLRRLFDEVPSTREICGYGDGIVRSEEWRICGGQDGSPGYEKTRAKRPWT